MSNTTNRIEMLFETLFSDIGGLKLAVEKRLQDLGYQNTMVRSDEIIESEYLSVLVHFLYDCAKSKNQKEIDFIMLQIDKSLNEKDSSSYLQWSFFEPLVFLGDQDENSFRVLQGSMSRHAKHLSWIADNPLSQRDASPWRSEIFN